MTSWYFLPLSLSASMVMGLNLWSRFVASMHLGFRDLAGVWMRSLCFCFFVDLGWFMWLGKREEVWGTLWRTIGRNSNLIPISSVDHVFVSFTTRRLSEYRPWHWH